MRVPNGPKSNPLTESPDVKTTAAWRERTCPYPRRSRQPDRVVTTNDEKSAKGIVP